jgi:hypothetical protein
MDMSDTAEMHDTVEMRDLPWHVMQRSLAESGAQTGSYAILRKQMQPHWKFAPTADSWLSRARNGLRDTLLRR